MPASWFMVFSSLSNKYSLPAFITEHELSAFDTVDYIRYYHLKN